MAGIEICQPLTVYTYHQGGEILANILLMTQQTPLTIELSGLVHRFRMFVNESSPHSYNFALLKSGLTISAARPPC